MSGLLLHSNIITRLLIGSPISASAEQVFYEHITAEAAAVGFKYVKRFGVMPVQLIQAHLAWSLAMEKISKNYEYLDQIPCDVACAALCEKIFENRPFHIQECKFGVEIGNDEFNAILALLLAVRVLLAQLAAARNVPRDTAAAALRYVSEGLAAEHGSSLSNKIQEGEISILPEFRRLMALRIV